MQNKLMAKFTRAGVAVLVFGMLTAMLPESNAVMAASGTCTTTSSSSTNTAQYVVGGVAAGALLGGLAGPSFFPARTAKPKVSKPTSNPAVPASDQSTTPGQTTLNNATPTQDQSGSNLSNFIKAAP